MKSLRRINGILGEQGGAVELSHHNTSVLINPWFSSTDSRDKTQFQEGKEVKLSCEQVDLLSVQKYLHEKHLETCEEEYLSNFHNPVVVYTESDF